MKKVTAMFLVFIMTIMTLAACSSGAGKETTGGAVPGDKQGNASEASGSDVGESGNVTASEGTDSSPYAGIDISKPVEITMYVLGTEATDKDKVVEKINERLKETLNATLNLQVIPLSEYATRYPLILSGGENVDLIYAAPWVNFKENVSRKAFLELTDEFLNTYMPQTVANEPEEAFKQMLVDGKLYAIPRNQTTYSSFYNVVMIRKDLREKYNIPELKSLEDYENFLFTISENEKGIYGFYNMPTFKPAIYALFEVNNNLLQIVKGDYFIWKDDGTFDLNEVRYYFDSEEYRDYVMRMATWAQKGVWPSDAIAGTVSPNDYFTQGRSASLMVSVDNLDGIWNMAESNGITDIEAFDIFPEATSRKSDYSGDAIAIPYVSKNPERAAMVLDMLKSDRELNLLIVGGIEGEHYVYDEATNTRSEGPAASAYTWDSFSWAIRNDWNPKLPTRDVTKTLTSAVEQRTLGDYWPCSGFSFNNEAVKTQVTLVESLINEYSTSFDLGVFGEDTEAKLDEFIGKLKDAGLEDIKAEYLKQLGEYIGQ